MTAIHMDKSTERAWKHRFAQILFESFCGSGIKKTAALDDAYAHADAQYLVRGLGSPEDEALAALTWIRADEAPTSAGTVKSGDTPANPHNGAYHIEPIAALQRQAELPE